MVRQRALGVARSAARGGLVEPEASKGAAGSPVQIRFDDAVLLAMRPQYATLSCCFSLRISSVAVVACFAVGLIADDCRNWMRLHFWAMRECGLHRHHEFWQWYQQFIAHFIRIYEPTAPPYVPADASWSADEKNIEVYHQQGNHMLDIVGIGRY